MEPERGRSAVRLSQLAALLQLIGGILIVFFFGLAGFGLLIGGPEIDFATLAVAALFVFLGVWLIRLSGKRRRLIRLFRQYGPMLSTDPLRSLDNLATLTGHPVENVRRDVEQMVRRRFFGSAYVNLDANCLVLVSQDQPPAPPPGPQTAAGRTVNCPGCGAANHILPGAPPECEFCGSKLEETKGGDPI